MLGVLLDLFSTSATKWWCREENKGKKKKQKETEPQGSEISLKVNKALAQELFISFGKC